LAPSLRQSVSGQMNMANFRKGGVRIRQKD
jgi:hypothetical protein